MEFFINIFPDEYQDYVPGGIQPLCKSVCKVNLALGPSTTRHSTIPAKMLHTIVTLSTGWANYAHVIILALSGISSFTVHACSWSCTDTEGSTFPGSIRLSEQCWASLSPGWKSDANFRKHGLSRCRVAAGPNAQHVLVQVEAPGIWAPCATPEAAPHLHQLLPRWHRQSANVPLSTCNELHQYNLCRSKPVKLLIRAQEFSHFLCCQQFILLQYLEEEIGY